ncbi:MAG: DUF1538 domain-containing protein [Desulfocapsaceae bacterium]|jgi:hypothetical protein|nr:DUF1538 domain-containing protein [Desulfocapsaceae bacterium]
MEIIGDLVKTLMQTGKDLLPIILLFGFFQIFVLKQGIDNPRKIFAGCLYVFIGLTLFLAGLDKALFPIGEIMASQLTDPAFLGLENNPALSVDWKSYGWVYLFAAAIGFSTTIAEPSLIAVALKASEVSGGAISQRGLRITVAIGVSFGICLGSFRIITGTPLYLYILAGYLIVIFQTFFAPRSIIPLAYDSGGVTTSTVTVPVVAALGLGLSSSVPGRNPAIDGFGLIAFASLFPIIAVLGYGQFSQWQSSRSKQPKKERKDEI